MMNVQVCLKTVSNDSATLKFELRVDSNETVKSVKDKIAASQLIAFPEHTLKMDGEAMSVNKKLSDYGVKDATSLDFVVEATESSVVKQLTEMLRARDLTCDELGLLYCYKYGVSINQALKTVGLDIKLQDFVQNQKAFVVENSKVSLVREDTTLKPISVSKQLSDLLRENGPTMEVTALCSKFVQKFHVSVANVTQQRPADFLQQEKDTFTLLGGGLVTLKEFAAAEKAKLQTRTARSRSPVQARPKTAERPQSRQVEQARSRPAALSQPKTKVQDDTMYQELHTKISSRSFNSRVAQVLTTVAQTIEEKTFLNVAEVVKGGSVGKGTPIEDCNDAELVFFVKGLPSEGHQKWLPPLLRSVQSTLDCHLPSGMVSDMTCTDNSVQMMVKNTVKLDLRFSPVFESYAATVQTLGSLGPNVRKLFEPSFVKESTQFVAKQPGHVKVTIRLLKWWREQQAWSCDLTRPSDYLLELVAVYVAQQCGKLDQAQMIANCMSLMARFDQVRIVWSNFYNKSDIWAPLMMQRPVLMDPVNPFRNVADPQDFDARELMSLSASTHFFW
jgi:hypothetical protein